MVWSDCWIIPLRWSKYAGFWRKKNILELYYILADNYLNVSNNKLSTKDVVVEVGDYDYGTSAIIKSQNKKQCKYS